MKITNLSKKTSNSYYQILYLISESAQHQSRSVSKLIEGCQRIPVPEALQHAPALTEEYTYSTPYSLHNLEIQI